MKVQVRNLHISLLRNSAHPYACFDAVCISDCKNRGDEDGCCVHLCTRGACVSHGLHGPRAWASVKVLTRMIPALRGGHGN